MALKYFFFFFCKVYFFNIRASLRHNLLMPESAILTGTTTEESAHKLRVLIATEGQL